MLAVLEVPWRHRAPATRHEGACRAVYAILQQADPDLAARLHASQALPRFSASLERNVLRLGALDDEILAALVRGIGRRKARLVRTATFESLYAGAGESRMLQLRFLSPTQFRSQGRSDVLPSPENVFGALIRRWRACGGPEIPDVRLSAAKTAAIHVRTVRVWIRAHNHPDFGAVGEALYRLPAGVERWYHALAAFAEIAGVGSHTAYGFGRAEYVESQATAATEQEQKSA